MKQIKESANEHHWPRTQVRTIEARKRDLIIRIADWTRDKDEPAWDVEIYIGGVYDFNESNSFTKYKYGDLAKAKVAAVCFAKEQILKLL